MEVVTILIGPGGPVVSIVPILLIDFERRLTFPDKERSGPATGEGVGAAASEESEYVKVCGVKTSGEAAGHGVIGDVHYTILFVEDGLGVVKVTERVAKEVGTLIDDARHANVYGISIYYNDPPEITVTKKIPGEYVKETKANLIKLTIGYSSGVVGVAEATIRAKES